MARVISVEPQALVQADDLSSLEFGWCIGSSKRPQLNREICVVADHAIIVADMLLNDMADSRIDCCFAEADPLGVRDQSRTLVARQEILRPRIRSPQTNVW
jgi:hypothetical protein